MKTEDPSEECEQREQRNKCVVLRLRRLQLQLKLDDEQGLREYDDTE